MNKKLISIVLPIYNVEKYLDECILSILKQPFSEYIEILLIDDGSTDSSANICDKYANQYENCVVFHKKNGGLSDARNFGLLKSKGEYVFFLDSDDFICDNALEKIIQVLKNNNLDILLWDCQIVNEQSQIVFNRDSDYYVHYGLQNGQIYSPEQLIMLQLNDHNDYLTTVWAGLYNRQFLFDNNLWFEKNMIHEDELWTQKAFINAKKIYYLQENLYNYRQRQDSIMNSLSKDYSKNLQSLIYGFNSLFCYIDWKINQKEFKNKIKANIAKRYLSNLKRYDISKYRHLKPRINRFEIFKYANGFDKIRALLLMINTSLYCKISQIIDKIKKS